MHSESMSTRQALDPKNCGASTSAFGLSGNEAFPKQTILFSHKMFVYPSKILQESDKRCNKDASSLYFGKFGAI